MSRFMAMLGAFSLLTGHCVTLVFGDDGQNQKDSPQPAAAQASGLDDFVIGEPIRHANLAVFPVISKTPKTEDQYLTLEEGLKTKTVEVYEVGAQPRAVTNAPNAANAPRQEHQTQQAPQTNQPLRRPNGSLNATINLDGEDAMDDVNRLMVVNRSTRPLYLMPGELIYGGRQDRCIAEETIIAADGKPTPINVFCVEHGRWGMRSESEMVTSVVPLIEAGGEKPNEQTLKELSSAARQGKFVVQAGSLNKEGRVAVQGSKDQGEVWDKVGKANASSGVASQSGAFTANFSSGKVLKQLGDYLKELDKPVAESKQVVGAIVAINGKVEAVDVFQSTPLFQKLWPKILRGHAFDAANAASQNDAKKECTVKDAQDFMLAAMKSGEEKHSDEGGLLVTKRDSENVISFSAREQRGGQAMGGMGGMGFGGAVHSAGFSK
jgi:hypothetical protein